MTEQDLWREIVNVFERIAGLAPKSDWGNPDFNANRRFTIRKE